MAFRPGGRAGPVNAPLPPATQEQLARVAEHLSSVSIGASKSVAVRQPELARRTGMTLADIMHRDGMADLALHQAAEKYRNLWWEAQEPSQGVATYGDEMSGYTHRSRMLAATQTDARMKAFDALKHATVAAFGVVAQDGKSWRVDEELMRDVIPALLSTEKSITQAAIGRARSGYKGKAQVGAAGGTVILEVLHRLALHFGYRTR